LDKSIGFPSASTSLERISAPVGRLMDIALSGIFYSGLILIIPLS